MSARTALRFTVLALVVAALAGCAGSPSSTSAWSDTADKTIGQAVSGLGTAQVVLKAYPEGRLTHAYAVGTLTDAVEVTAREVSAFDTVQPPDRLHPLNHKVDDALHRAVELLSVVRTEYSSPALGDDEAHQLLEQVEAALKELDALTRTVKAA
jgi:hypothetical protein